MRVNFINNNGRYQVSTQPAFSPDNRAFRYADALFETMLWTNGRIRLVDYHSERLQNGLQTLQMTGWDRFSPAFLTEIAAGIIAKNEFEQTDCRLRLQVFRSGGGLYSPISNEAHYVLSVEPFLGESDLHDPKTGLNIDLYTEQFKASSGLSALKSTNSLIFVLAGLYRKNKGLDEVILLNEAGMICESMSSNIFVAFEGRLYTPALSEGCVAGVMRRKVLELAALMDIEITEAKIDPSTLEEADEVFLTNAVRGIQWVMGYRQKRYFKKWTKIFREALAYETEHI